MVISWIINNIDRDLVEYFLDYITSTQDLWTRIHFILGPVPLPPVDETIQREISRGKSKVEKTSSGFNPSENQKPEKTNQNQDLKEKSKILNKGTGNLLGVTDSTTTRIHAELKAENNEKKGLNSNERNTERNKKNEGQKILGKNSIHHRSSDSSGRNSNSKFGGALNSRELIWESKFQISE